MSKPSVAFAFDVDEASLATLQEAPQHWQEAPQHWRRGIANGKGSMRVHPN
jgi:hypothetical protein